MAEVAIQIGDCATHLGAVKGIWRANVRWLGFFPDGAFEDAFKRKHVLVALDRSDVCVGYLLYRLTTWEARIVHLAVSQTHHGKGVARRLVEHAIGATKNKLGIGLHCRRDFPANQLWPHLGFSHHGEYPGRGKDAKPLIFWWRSHRDADLFNEAAKRLRESKVAAVLDLNILIGQMDEDPPYDTPAKALKADWLQPELELFVTNETFPEISSIEDTARRERVQSFARQYHTLPVDEEAYTKVRDQLRPLFPDQMMRRDKADLAQLAAAVAASASYFVTEDTGLLSIAEEVEKCWGLRIVRPTELVVRLDELKRSEEYRPARFSGSDLTVRLLAHRDRPQALAAFQNPHMNEKKSHFRTRLDGLLSEPSKFACHVVLGDEGVPLGLVARELCPSPWDEHRIHLLRVAAGPQAGTLARQLVWQCLLRARSEGAQLIRMTDPYPQGPVAAALDEFGFLRGEEAWVKLNVEATGPASEIGAALHALGPRAGLGQAQIAEWSKLLVDPATTGIPDRALEQEHFLWPAKIANADIATYIIPIRPYWAQELFEERLAGRELFGRKEELALSVEGVYYRRRRGPAIQAPARILWYVSKDRRSAAPGTMCVRAYSRLEEVDIGRPKELFSRHRRLGIYDWKEVFETANGDLSQVIMALRFRATELFPKPIPRDRLKRIMQTEGIHAPMQSPVCIPARAFLAIYTEAFASAKDGHAKDAASHLGPPTARA